MRRPANDNPPPRGSSLPAGVAPRGFSREQAAEYIGVSPTKFDGMVRDRTMPPPKLVGSRTVWDRHRLDLAFDDLPDREAVNGWDAAGDCYGGEVQAPGRNRRG